MNKMDPKNSKKREDILNGGNVVYLEYLQSMYQKDPKSVDQSWSSFFEPSDSLAEKASWSRSDWPVDQKQDFGIQDNSFWGSQSTEALEEKILAYSEKSDVFSPWFRRHFVFHCSLLFAAAGGVPSAKKSLTTFKP